MMEKLVMAMAVVFVVALLGLLVIQWNDCANDGKAFVRGAVGFECVAR